MTEILAKRLRECRKARGYTQFEAAVYSDITEKAYHNYEVMVREPRLEIVMRIADAFDVSIDYLVGRTDEKKVNKQK